MLAKYWFSYSSKRTEIYEGYSETRRSAVTQQAAPSSRGDGSATKKKRITHIQDNCTPHQRQSYGITHPDNEALVSSEPATPKSLSSVYTSTTYGDVPELDGVYHATVRQ